MTFSGDDDDTSAGRRLQGGHRDHDSPGPRRRSGNSFWWFAVVLLVGAGLAVAVLTTRSHKDAPAERGTVPVSGGAPSAVSGVAGGSGAGPR